MAQRAPSKAEVIYVEREARSLGAKAIAGAIAGASVTVIAAAFGVVLPGPLLAGFFGAAVLLQPFAPAIARARARYRIARTLASSSSDLQRALHAKAIA